MVFPVLLRWGGKSYAIVSFRNRRVFPWSLHISPQKEGLRLGTGPMAVDSVDFMDTVVESVGGGG